MNASQSGMTLVELLVAMAIASLTGAMLVQMVICFQGRIITEIGRNDLQDRAERLMRFIANDLSGSAFLIGPRPQTADGLPLTLVHDSEAGDPAETLAYAIVAEDIVAGDDRLTIVKAESFSPPMHVVMKALPGDQSLYLNRRPNRTPGSSREIQPVPEAINQIVLANHPLTYPVQEVDQELHLAQALATEVPAATELLGVRVSAYALDAHGGTHRLRRDDFTSRQILDDAIDGLQFEYLQVDGSYVSQPLSVEKVRGIRVALLVRDLRQDRNYKDEKTYSLGNRTYGPFLDHYRRYLCTAMIEVKNNGLF